MLWPHAGLRPPAGASGCWAAFRRKWARTGSESLALRVFGSRVRPRSHLSEPPRRWAWTGLHPCVGKRRGPRSSGAIAFAGLGTADEVFPLSAGESRSGASCDNRLDGCSNCFNRIGASAKPLSETGGRFVPIAVHLAEVLERPDLITIRHGCLPYAHQCSPELLSEQLARSPQPRAHPADYLSPCFSSSSDRAVTLQE